jgi:RHS repeat-associated protein
VTGLQYLRDRYMDPNTGRFTRRDSFAGYEEKPVSTHPYIYANNNPVTFTDPSGFSSLAELMVNIKELGRSAANNIRQGVNLKKWIDRAEGASDLLFVAALFGRVGINLFLKYSDLFEGWKNNSAHYDYLNNFAATDGADGAFLIKHEFKKPVGEIRGMDIELSLGNLGELVAAGVVDDSWGKIYENLAFKVKGSAILRTVLRQCPPRLR